MNRPKSMLSLSALARRLDLPYPRALALAHAGILIPTRLGPNNIRLFDDGEIPKLRAVVEKAAKGKGIS